MSKTVAEDRVTVELPFSGFYNTVHDQMLDMAMEQINSDDSGEEIEMITTDNVQWAQVHLAYAQAYLKKARAESGLNMEFQKIISPRDYATGNDQIIATIPLRDLEDAYAALDEETRQAWRDRVKEALTPRPGYVPFSQYSDNAEDWGPIAGWDDAQRDLFFNFYAAPLIGDEYMLAESASEVVDDKIWEAVIDPSVVPGHVDYEAPEEPA
jgi:hypothetical protein